jgi:two-component sensor histidine kinase
MSLFYSYGTEAGTVQPVFHLKDARLNVETVIPLGLIIKELVSAAKICFSSKRRNHKIGI